MQRQVPVEEPNDELNMFLMERLFSALRRVLECPGPRVEDGGVPEPVPQQSQNTVDQHPQA